MQHLSIYNQTLAYQPKQMLLKKDKDEDWCKTNMNYWEMLGIAQLQSGYRKMSKNIRMAKGKVDIKDYMPTADNPDAAYIQAINGHDDFNVTSIKSFPLAANFINTMVGEMAKMTNEVVIKSVDKFGESEVLKKKKEEVINSIVADAKAEYVRMLQQNNVPINEDTMLQVDQEVRKLPDIQKYYTSEYRDPLELWCTGQKEYNDLRFSMREKKILAFEDSLTNDKVCFHIRQGKDDYDVKLESALNTFIIKSPETRYYANGIAAGVVKMYSIPEIQRDFGDKMTIEQMEALEAKHKDTFGLLGSQGYPNDLYDSSKPRAQQLTNMDVAQSNYWSKWLFENPNVDIWDKTIHQQYMNPFDYPGMIRVTELYWVSQRKIGWLTRIDAAGNITRAIVSEEYEVFDKPVYNVLRSKNRDEESLIFGDHIEWKWVPEVWKGVKIGGNIGHPGLNNPEPIYLDVEPLLFQMRSKHDYFDVLLPIQGASFSDRDGEPSAPIDRLRPYQTMLDLVMNKITDIEIDEIGSFVTFNQKILPNKSLGQSWEQDRELKAIEAARMYKLLPTDKSIENLQGERVFGDEVRVVDASETNRLLQKMQMASFIRNEAYLSVGFNPQRFGQVSEYQSADGQRQAATASYSQTDRYFSRFTDDLMPRVEEQMLYCDMWYNRKRGGMAKVSFLNNRLENKYFEVASEELMRPVGVFALTTPDMKEVMLRIQNYLFNSQQSQGLTIFDVARVFQAKTSLQMEDALRDAEIRQRAIEEQRQKAELEKLQLQIQAQEKMNSAALQQKSDNEQANRDTSRYVADRQNLEQQQGNGSDPLKEKELDLYKDIETRKMDLKQQEIELKAQTAALNSQTALNNPVAGEKTDRPTIKI